MRQAREDNLDFLLLWEKLPVSVFRTFSFMWISTLLPQFLSWLQLLQLRQWGCGSLSRGKMQNQLLQPWELCRWFSYSSSKKGSQAASDSTTEHCLATPSHEALVLVQRLKRLWSASRCCAHERKSDIRPGPKLGKCISGPWGSPIRWLKNLTRQVLLIAKRWKASWGKPPTTGQ